jgi:hypothetical protein
MRRFVTVCLVMCMAAFAFARPADAGWWRRAARWGYYPVRTAVVVAAPCCTTVAVPAPCCQGTVAVAPSQTPSAPQPTLAPSGK